MHAKKLFRPDLRSNDDNLDAEEWNEIGLGRLSYPDPAYSQLQSTVLEETSPTDAAG